jgi:DNA invertase Pin-like site-specific DNA recombinase
MPEANKFMLHVMAAVAEQEAALISERTKAALAARKARGGLQGLALPERRDQVAQVVAKATKSRVEKADTHAANVLPIIDTIKSTGASLRDIAKALNERGIKTARGGTWYATTVANVLDRRKRVSP